MIHHLRTLLTAALYMVLAVSSRAQSCEWSAVGSGINGTVEALATFDDGSGPALYAGGNFTTAGGTPASYIAKWNGSGWSSVGSGTNVTITCLTVFNDGNGPALIAGGAFIQAGGVAVNYIAKWDGSSWSPLGSGLNNWPFALAVFDDGSGPALYVGGRFTQAGGNPAIGIARWDGTSWSSVGSGISGGFGVVYALTELDDGSGPKLYAGGSFEQAGESPALNIAKWDGTSWLPLGSGLNSSVFAMASFDDGSGPSLYAGGQFNLAGGVAANRIAKWDGNSWSSLGSVVNGGGVSGGGGLVTALTALEDITGSMLVAGGQFEMADGSQARRIAKWDGSSWSPLGSGVSSTTGNSGVSALGVFDDGNDIALYAGGVFTQPGARIARWSCSPPCGVDLDENGVLNFFDIAIFMTYFQIRNPIADFNNDGLFNFFDFATFLKTFNAGCS